LNRAATKTDNSYLAAKVRLRLDNLPAKREITVLDAYCGSGQIWQTVQERANNHKITVTGIDSKRATGRMHLVGDNLKFLAGMDLSRFDVVDLDAYGCPYKQLSAVLRGGRLKPGTIVFVTWIQSQFGILPRGFLQDLGYTKGMVRKSPTLFSRHGQQKLLDWLSTKQIKYVKIYSDGAKKKNYLCFQVG
jgi:hypothetical protein